ncbi:MAG: twin-arginine translocation pathway signal protein [Marinosulfonomonas sp.]|nr:twin-arginine translocation pathway signal protein [Marinosulfonomonas sp.]
MGKKEEGTNSRRNFLKLAAASAPAVAVVAATGTAAQAADVKETSSGLQDTAHTRAYFDSLTF